MSSQLLPSEFSRQIASDQGVAVILSVDDEPTILFTREKILEAAGYKVLSASDGEEALNLFANNPVHLVLLDFAMPGMDGGAVAKELKRLNQAVPVIMVSASPLAEQALACADCFITKGQGPLLLLDQVNQLLQSFHSTQDLSKSHRISISQQESLDENPQFQRRRSNSTG
jgi:CheY-like chemotaxis protein